MKEDEEIKIMRNSIGSLHTLNSASSVSPPRPLTLSQFYHLPFIKKREREREREKGLDDEERKRRDRETNRTN